MAKAALEAQHPNNRSTIVILDEWIAEANVMSEEERAQGDAEWRGLMRDLDAWRESPRTRLPHLADFS